MDCLTRFIESQLYNLNKGGGITPSGIINISTNGEYDVTNYAIANVNVASSNNANVTTDITSSSALHIQSYITELPELDMVNRTSLQKFFESCFNLHSVRLKNTSNVTNFNDCFSASRIENIQGLDTSNGEQFNGMFYACQTMETAPEMDLRKATNISRMFNSCISLKNVPVYNPSALTTYFSNIFGGCIALTNESLNNILQTCINATSYTGTKTLKEIGLTSAQATICTGLSNWTTAQSNGWTTGY